MKIRPVYLVFGESHTRWKSEELEELDRIYPIRMFTSVENANRYAQDKAIAFPNRIFHVVKSLNAWGCIDPVKQIMIDDGGES